MIGTSLAGTVSSFLELPRVAWTISGKGQFDSFSPQERAVQVFQVRQLRVLKPVLEALTGTVWQRVRFEARPDQGVAPAQLTSSIACCPCKAGLRHWLGSASAPSLGKAWCAERPVRELFALAPWHVLGSVLITT